MSQWLLEKITARLVSATEHAERLRTQLTEAEDDLERLRAAQQVVKEILAGQHDARQSAMPGPDGRGELFDQATDDDVVPMYEVALPAWRCFAGSPATTRSDGTLGSAK